MCTRHLRLQFVFLREWRSACGSSLGLESVFDDLLLSCPLTGSDLLSAIGSLSVESAEDSTPVIDDIDLTAD
jgi:hypothetical protein